MQLPVGFEGASREPVFSDTVAVSSTVRSPLVERHAPSTGPSTRWSNDSIRVWSSKPWSQNGAQMPTVFHSRVGFRVTFNDFTEVRSRAVQDAVAKAGVYAQCIGLGSVRRFVAS